MTTTDHGPKRPAAAYMFVASQLTDAYFKTKPPESGAVELEITSRIDGVPTRWMFKTTDAQVVMTRCHRAGVRCVVVLGEGR